MNRVQEKKQRLLKCDMLLAGPSVGAYQKNYWHVHFYCDVLVRGLGLGGLRKQTALRCNQHSQKAPTCLMRNLECSPSVTGSEEEKNNNSSICRGWGEAPQPTHCDTLSQMWYERDAHTALLSLCGSSPEKARHESMQYLVRGIGKMRKAKSEKWRCLIVFFTLNNGAGGDSESVRVCGESSVDTCEVIRVSFERRGWICVSASLSPSVLILKLQYIYIYLYISIFHQNCHYTLRNAGLEVFNYTSG